MTTQERREQLLEQRADLATYLEQFDFGSTKRAIADVDRQLQELVIDEKRERFRPLLVRPAYARPFVARLAADALEKAARDLDAVYARLDGTASGSFGARCVYVPPVGSEDAYARFLHEHGHAVQPAADGLQHRHTLNEKLTSAISEAFAWVHAAESALVWTPAMQSEAEQCLKTYLGDATPAERGAMNRTLDAMRTLVRPAPDSTEGRRLRAEEIRRETSPRFVRARELGFALPTVVPVRPELDEVKGLLTRLSRGEGAEAATVDEPIDREARRLASERAAAMRELEAENRRLQLERQAAEQARRRAEREARERADALPWAANSGTMARYKKLQLIVGGAA